MLDTVISGAPLDQSDTIISSSGDAQGDILNRWIPNKSEVLMLLAIVAVHTLLVRWALTLVTPEEGISLMWLPDGFLLGVFVLLRYRLWPWLIAMVVATTLWIETLTTTRPPGLIGFFLASNLFESIAGALVYRRFCGDGHGLRELSHLAVFIVVCVLAIPLLSALLAAAAVTSYGLSDDFFSIYRTWHSSAGLGILFVAPLVVEGAVRWREHRSLFYGSGGGFIPWLPLTVLLLTLFDGVLARVGIEGASLSAQGLIFVGLPVLCIAAAKFGVWGGIVTSSVMVIAAVQITALGYGPFSLEGLSAAESVFRMQSYLAMAVIATLFTAVAVERMREAQDEVKKSLARFEATFEYSPAAMFEEDYSAVYALLVASDMPTRGGHDWLSRHSELVGHCAELVRVENVNQRAVELFEADSKEQLCGGSGSLVSAPSLEVFLEELAAFFEGSTRFSGAAVQTTLAGQFIETKFEATIVPGHEEDWRRVIVAIQDVSPAAITAQ